MNILIIQGSPNGKSFAYSNARYYEQKAKELGHAVDFVDLSQADFDPVLRHGYMKHMEDESYPKLMQEKLTWANHIAFFFPIWWSAEPSILKGWLDRVLTPRFAYRKHGENELHPKS